MIKSFADMEKEDMVSYVRKLVNESYDRGLAIGNQAGFELGNQEGYELGNQEGKQIGFSKAILKLLGKMNKQEVANYFDLTDSEIDEIIAENAER